MDFSVAPSQVGWLLTDICVHLGHCSAAREQERFEQLVSLGPAALADAVLVAAGINPEHEKQLRREVHEFVAARFARWQEIHGGPTG